MVNPHWEERFTEEVPIRDDWSPLGEYGQHGEFEGHLLQDDPSSYTSDWQDYPEMGNIPPSPSNPFRYPEVNEEVSIYDNWPPAGRPPYPEQYWTKPYPSDDGIGRPPMVTLRNKPIPHRDHFDSPKEKHAGMVADTRRREFLEALRKSQGRPPYPEEYWNKPYPHDDEVFEDEGNWYDNIPWWLLPPPLGVGIETLLGNR